GDSDPRPLRKVQSELERRVTPADHEVLTQPRRLAGERRVVTAGVIVEPMELTVGQPRPAELVPLNAHIKPVVPALGNGLAAHRDVCPRIKVVLQGELTRPAIPAFAHPRVLAESRFVAADGDELDRGRDTEAELRTRRRVVPL